MMPKTCVAWPRRGMDTIKHVNVFDEAHAAIRELSWATERALRDRCDLARDLWETEVYGFTADWERVA